jgi:short-subunit dehydrogenase
MELRGRSVLVTGATGGLGQAIVRRLRAEGCVLTVTGRRADVLDALAGEVEATAVVADFGRREDLQRVADLAGEVDILVANAGVPGTGELTEYSLEQLDRVLDVNLRAPVALARLLGERMLARGQGHVVFISSLSGKTANPVSSLYNATKFGLRGFALALRQDWGPRGVGVSCVNPGPIGDAGMFHEASKDIALPAGFRPKLPADVAGAVVKAITNDRAEIDVADPVMRAGVVLGQLAPQAAAALTRLVGADQVSHQLAEGSADKR